MTTGPDPDAEFSPPRLHKGQSRPWMRWWEVLIILGIMAVLVALLLPFRRGAPNAARRMQCSSNLRNIALGVLQYQQTYHHLPPAATVDARGKVLHSWRTLILPFVNEQELYDSIDLTKPWDDPANARARETAVRIYHCPDSPDPKNTTTYLGLCGPEFCFAPTTARPMSDITDSHAATMMVIEADPRQAIPWMQPTDADASVLDQLASDATKHHSGGSNVAFVDGAVRFLKSKVPATTLRRLATIAGGESISHDEY